MTNITTEIREIGPDEATELLNRNDQNRNIVSKAISKLSSDMLEGEWIFDGAPIRIAASGKLLDGQHRLTAIVQSGTTQKFVVVTGLKEEAQAVMDTGRKRTLANALTIQGETNTNQLAAFLMLSFRWNHGVRGSRLFKSGNVTAATAAALEPSIPVILDYLEQNPEFRDIVKEGQVLARATSLAPSIASLVWLVFHNIEFDDAEEFFERLKDGAGLEVGSPILALRDRLHAISRDNRMRGTRISSEHVLALVLKAWNIWREGKPLVRLYFKIGGASPEAFPEPI